MNSRRSPLSNYFHIAPGRVDKDDTMKPYAKLKISGMFLLLSFLIQATEVSANTLLDFSMTLQGGTLRSTVCSNLL